MWLFMRHVMCTILVLGNQKSISAREPLYCDKYDLNSFTNITAKEIKCFVDTDLILVENISKHVRHVKEYLEHLHFAYDRIFNITSQIGNKLEYLGNAMNMFSLMRRSTKDWVLPLKIAFNLPVGFNPVDRVIKRFDAKQIQEDSTPSKEIHMNSGYSGLSRLQSVYHISSDTLANGKLQGAYSHAIMATDDCFEFAKYYYFEELNYERALDWLDQTLMRLDVDKKARVTEKQVLELYFLAKCFTGDFQGSKIAYKTLIEKYKKFSSNLRLLEDFEIMARHGCKRAGNIASGRRKIKNIGKVDKEIGIEEFRDGAFKNLKEHDPKLFELCNHPHNVYSGTAKLLKCRYIHYNHPALKIASFKVEEFHLDPPILLLHDIISDAEISEFMTKIKPKFQMQEAKKSYDAPHWGTAEIGGGSIDEVWVRDNKFAVAARLARRVAILTGWSRYRAEPFKLVIYGVSGALSPHIDTVDESKSHLRQYSDYSTAMFHLNDVNKGGYTIFPALNVTVVPVKGSALLWFNRKPDGTSDQLSLHASCPVLHGSKWVLNKWFHMDRQIFPKCTKRKNSSFKYFYL